jgi:hypothetical protein
LAARCFREPYFVEKGKEASFRVWRDTMAVIEKRPHHPEADPVAIGFGN